MNTGGPAGFLRRALALAAAALLASCVTVKGGKEGERSEKAAASLRELARAVETLDADRVAALYASDAFSAVLDRSPRHTTGHIKLREDIAKPLAPVASIHVEPSGDEKTWRDGDRTWTIQDFHVAGTLKDGRGFTLDVHYSAVFRRIEKRWLIEYEHLMGPPPVAKTSPARPS